MITHSMAEHSGLTLIENMDLMGSEGVGFFKEGKSEYFVFSL